MSLSQYARIHVGNGTGPSPDTKVPIEVTVGALAELVK